jgi:hypothetical protein
VGNKRNVEKRRPEKKKITENEDDGSRGKGKHVSRKQKQLPPASGEEK